MRIPDGDQISSRDKTSTALLCFFLGFLGVHKFYVGKHIQGIIHLTLFFVALIVAAAAGGDTDADPVIGLFLPAISIWVLVDFIRILANRFTDGEGKWITSAPVRAAEPESNRPRSAPRADQRMQQRILMCAKQEGGAIMPTTVAMRTGFDVDAVKDHLESLVDKGYAELQPTKDGSIVYVFRDMLTDERREELELL